MIPSLPQHARNPSKRKAELAKLQSEYRWSYDYPKGIATAAEVPFSQEFSIPYVLEVGKLNATLLANHVALDVSEFGEKDHIRLFKELHEEFGGLSGKKLRERGFGIHKEVDQELPAKWPCSAEDYLAFYELIKEPPVVQMMQKQPEKDDEIFAWQRLAGANPLVIERISERLPENFPVTDAHFQKALPNLNDSLQAALQEGRLYCADYKPLDGVQTGTWDKGQYQKFIYAPLALFVQCQGSNPRFLPVAIQWGQKPGPDNPIVTPADGEPWSFAKLTVQVADGNYHEMISHLGLTHMVIEGVMIACYRQLSPKHPLRVLLEPHFEYTLALNDYACKHLIAPGGSVEIVLAGSLPGSFEVMARGLSKFSLATANPRETCKQRGVDNTDGLPQYPYRDDALLLWDAIHDFASAYVKLYYETDQDVLDDTELQAWLHETGAEDGGRIPGVPEVQSVEQLAKHVATVIFIASAQHSAVNFAQFPYMSYCKNVPGAGYVPTPKAGQWDSELLSKILPPLSSAETQFQITYQLSGLHMSKLGHYPWFHFKDPRVSPVVSAFQKALDAAEQSIQSREQSRLLPYPFLIPSQVLQSISI